MIPELVASVKFIVAMVSGATPSLPAAQLRPTAIPDLLFWWESQMVLVCF
ncbi:MAG TPA: hypothetical protein VND19_11870 [Acetobacteraceae bacterium]|nr:hypothetical protein [Acetobacteraceae bacterium]